MSSFCDNCGRVLKPTAKFCGVCGTALDTPQTDNSQNQTNYAPPPPPPPPPKQKRSMGKAKKFGIGFVIFIVVFVVLGAIASSVSSGPTFTTPQLSEQEIKDKAIEDIRAGGNLLHNNDEFVGKIVKYSNTIKFVYGDNLLMGGDNLVRLNYDGDSCVVNRGDYITVWAVVVGLDTYSSFAGKQTVPELNALIIEGRC
jgi:hypothetical protein